MVVMTAGNKLIFSLIFVLLAACSAILIRYIRYGKGTLIPVYVESYLLDTPDGGAINITMSYQINRRRYFHQDFINSVYSFRFKYNL